MSRHLIRNYEVLRNIIQDFIDKKFIWMNYNIATNDGPMHLDNG